MPFTSLMVPLLLGSILLGPRRLPLFVLFILVLLFVAAEPAGRPDGPDLRRGRHPGPDGAHRPRRRPCGARGSASGERPGSRCSSTCATGSAARRVSRTCRPAGTPSPRSSPPAARRSQATSSSPRGRPTSASRSPWSTCPARGSRPASAGCSSRARSAGCWARCRRSSSCTAANDYLIRQEWEEGFATAIHLSVDLRTGDFEVRTAGHPPAALRLAGSGRWTVLTSEGPILGVIEDATFSCGQGHAAARRRAAALHRRHGGAAPP